MKEAATAEATTPSSSEQKLRPSNSAASVSTESASEQRKRRKHADNHSTRESSPGSERSSRGGPPTTDRTLRDRVVSVSEPAEGCSTREGSPASEDRGGLQAGSQNTERSLPDHVASIVDRGGIKDQRARVKRDMSGTVSSSASTCSEDSELRINDFLGKI